jgi:hypothetical protein
MLRMKSYGERLYGRIRILNGAFSSLVFNFVYWLSQRLLM